MLGIEAVGQGAEYDARGDVAQLVDGKNRPGHGVVHPPFLFQEGEDGGVIDEHQHDEYLGEAEKQQPAGFITHAGLPFPELGGLWSRWCRVF